MAQRSTQEPMCGRRITAACSDQQPCSPIALVYLCLPQPYSSVRRGAHMAQCSMQSMSVAVKIKSIIAACSYQWSCSTTALICLPGPPRGRSKHPPPQPCSTWHCCACPPPAQGLAQVVPSQAAGSCLQLEAWACWGSTLAA